jgi:hypothetical protein
MTRDEAKQILALYRPNTPEASDPPMAEALEFARRDPELAAWLDQHCAAFNAIRGKLKAIPVPQDLRRQIIVEHLADTRILPFTNRLLLVSAAAALALLTAIIWFQFAHSNQDTFDGYRNRMARMVQRGYFMQMFSADQTKIRNFFRDRGTPSDYVLPLGLAKLPGEGGVSLTWSARPVSLLCLNGATKPGEKNDLYLFTAKQSDIPGAPPPDAKPQFKKINSFMTASWTKGDRTYLLTASGGEDQAALEKYLQ